MVKTATDARSLVADIVDPEIPVLTIEDLGILRNVTETGGHAHVTITPTYSGCPAMQQIRHDIESVLQAHGYTEVTVNLSHDPPWTTDWMTEAARRKLTEFGIAPPTPTAQVVCPRCSADNPTVVSRFGSTACKALMVCSSCGEPFDHFKEF